MDNPPELNIPADDLQALRVAYYAAHGDHAAHNTEIGRLLGFSVGGTGAEEAF